MISLDASTLSQPDLYKLIIGGVVPRPIAFVSTKSRAGQGNLAPFSFFNGVSSNPPCLVFSVTRKPEGGKKDTLLNIEETGQLVINTVSEAMAVPMNQCAAEYPHGVDEMSVVGLTPLASIKVQPARVAESPIHYECELFKTVQVGDDEPGSATLVIARILYVHVRESAYSKGRLLIDELKPLARLGGPSYGRVSSVFDLARPQVKEDA